MDGQNDMSVKMNKVFVILLILITLFSSMSCSNATAEYRDKKHVEDILEEFYGGKFVVYETYHKQGQLFAEAAWADIPGHVFTVGLSEVSIDYKYISEPYIAIVEKGIEDTIEPYIRDFFPDSFFRVSIMDLGYYKKIDKGKPAYEEILEEATSVMGGYILVFVDKKRGTSKKYKDEYDFFTGTVDLYIEQNEMLPVSLTLYYMERANIEEIQEYLEESDNDNEFYDKLEKFSTVSACFKKNEETYVNSYETYEQIRKEFDDNE